MTIIINPHNVQIISRVRHMSKRPLPEEDEDDLLQPKSKRQKEEDPVPCFPLDIDAWMAVMEDMSHHNTSSKENGKLSITDVISLDRTCKYFHFELNLEYKLLWARFFQHGRDKACCLDDDGKRMVLRDSYADAQINICFACNRCSSVMCTRGVGHVMVTNKNFMDKCGGYNNHWFDTLKEARGVASILDIFAMVKDENISICQCTTGPFFHRHLLGRTTFIKRNGNLQKTLKEVEEAKERECKRIKEIGELITRGVARTVTVDTSI